MQGCQEKPTEQGEKLLCRVKLKGQLLFSPGILSRKLDSSSSSWYRKGDTLTNRDFPCKCTSLLQNGNSHPVFRASVSIVS